MQKWSKTLTKNAVIVRRLHRYLSLKTLSNVSVSINQQRRQAMFHRWQWEMLTCRIDTTAHYSVVSRLNWSVGLALSDHCMLGLYFLTYAVMQYQVTTQWKYHNKYTLSITKESTNTTSEPPSHHGIWNGIPPGWLSPSAANQVDATELTIDVKLKQNFNALARNK
jgi:hypothetical protein